MLIHDIWLPLSQCIHYQETTIMHLASSRSFTTGWNSRNVRTGDVNTTSLGVQRPVTTTKIRNGVIARQTMMSQIAWIATVVAEIGHETENVWWTLLICPRSVRDLVVCVPTEQTGEDAPASSHFSTITDLCMTVYVSETRPGVQRQLIIWRTKDGATVFLSVSLNCCIFIATLSVEVIAVKEQMFFSKYYWMRFFQIRLFALVFYREIVPSGQPS